MFFFFYYDSLDSKSAGRQSVASNMTKPDPEDDADSMAEYGEGDTGKKVHTKKKKEEIFYRMLKKKDKNTKNLMFDIIIICVSLLFIC